VLLAAMLALPTQAQASPVARHATTSVNADPTDSASQPSTTPSDSPTPTDAPTPSTGPTTPPAGPTPTSTPTPTASATPTGPEATRITLTTAKVNSARVGTSQAIGGTLQYQAADGTWQPLANTTLFLTVAGSYFDQVNSDGNGHFTFIETVPTAAASWTVGTASYLSAAYSASSAVFRFASVLQQTNLSLSDAAVDEYSDLTFSMNVTSTNGTLIGGKVYLLQSPNGKTGWVDLGYIKTTGGSYLDETAYVNNPHGYWKLYYAGAPGYSYGYSNTIHTFRYETRVVGGKPSATTVKKNAAVRFTGTLQRRGYGAWGALGKAPVDVIFRPYNSKTWYLMTSGKTTASGKFSISVKDPEAGTWAVLLLNGGSSYVVSQGPEIYIHTK
jgi:hypothetical protein